MRNERRPKTSDLDGCMCACGRAEGGACWGGWGRKGLRPSRQPRHDARLVPQRHRDRAQCSCSVTVGRKERRVRLHAGGKSGNENHVHSWLVADISVLAAKGSGGQGGPSLVYNKRLPRKSRNRRTPKLFDFMRTVLTRLERKMAIPASHGPSSAVS